MIRVINNGVIKYVGSGASIDVVSHEVCVGVPLGAVSRCLRELRGLSWKALNLGAWGKFNNE